MITITNYSKSNIDWSKVPAATKKGREDAEDIMEFYNDDAGIKEVIDLYLKQINDSQKKDVSKPKLEKKEVRETYISENLRLDMQRFDYPKTLKEFRIFMKSNYGRALYFMGSYSYPKALRTDHGIRYIGKVASTFFETKTTTGKDARMDFDKASNWEFKQNCAVYTENGRDKIVLAFCYSEPSGFKEGSTRKPKKAEVKLKTTATAATPKKAKKTKTVAAKSKPAKKSTGRKKNPNILKMTDREAVDHYDNEFKLLRRFYNLIRSKNAVTFRRVQLLHMAIQKAIVSKHVRKTSDEADILRTTSKKVRHLFDKTQEGQNNVDILIKDKSFYNRLEKLVKGKKIDYGVTLLRSYIGLQNTSPDVDKVERLLKRFENGIAKKRVTKTDRLWKEINAAITDMKDYIKNPDGEIDVESYALAKPNSKVCDNRVKCEGIDKNGKLLKGYKYVKGGNVVRVKGKKKSNIRSLGTVAILGNANEGRAIAVAHAKHANPSPYIMPRPTDQEIFAEPKQLAVIEPIRSVEVQENGKTHEGIEALKKHGFTVASDGPETIVDTFVLPGEIGQFIQTIQPHKALVLIKGTKHTSKSQLAMQVANAFGEKSEPVAYIDYEQGGLISKDTQNSLEWNTSPKGRNNIAIIGILEEPFEELQEFCKHVTVIVADSVTDLGITADQLNYLRTNFPKVIWVFISQVKSNGEMYGGNKMAHNPTVIIQCHPSEDPKKRYATLEKNRGNDLSLAYSMFHKKLINVEEFTDESIKFDSPIQL